jgi:phage shock protein A
MRQRPSFTLISRHREDDSVLNNRFAREALRQAASQVNQGVRDGARQFVESQVTPLRERIDELEGRVARLERQMAELLRERDRKGP